MPAGSEKVMCPVCHGQKSPDRAICDNCGVKSCANAHVISQDSNICPQCGWIEPVKKPPENHIPDTGTTFTPEAHDTALYLLCPRCQTRIESGEGRCPNCGFLRRI